jgi:hypothetical protein
MESQTGWLEQSNKRIGDIITNLLSLELALRLLLDEWEKQRSGGNDSLNLFTIKVGEWVPENSLTNRESLSQLIEKVNKLAEGHQLQDRLDGKIGKLRNGLAHGRLFSPDPNGPFCIMKFSKYPKNGMRQVEFSERLTSEWLDQQTEHTFNEIQKALKIGRSLGLKSFPED